MPKLCVFMVQENGGYKPGMCIDIQDNDFQMSEHMLRNFAVVRVEDEVAQGIQDNWMAEHPDFPTYYMLKGIALADLAARTSVIGILGRWQDLEDAVPIQYVQINPETDGFVYGE
jgi:hypothetical protein